MVPQPPFDDSAKCLHCEWPNPQPRTIRCKNGTCFEADSLHAYLQLDKGSGDLTVMVEDA